MSISNALHIAASGLAAASRGTDLVSHNLTNAQTPGYVRRDYRAQENIIGGTTLGGVTSGVIVRHASEQMNESIRRANSGYEEQSARTAGLQNIAQTVGDPDSEYALHNRLENLHQAFLDLSETPESPAMLRDTVAQAKIFANDIQSITTETQHLRQETDTKIATEVAVVNSALKQLEWVSQEMRMRQNTGQDVSALEDEKARLLEEISQRIPIRASSNGGDIHIMTTQGVTLFDQNAKQIEFQAAVVINASSAYVPPGDTPPDGYNDILSGLVVDGIDIAPGNPQGIDGGRLSGLIKMRDDDLPSVQKQLDALSSSLITTFRNADTTLAAGEDSLFTSNLPGQDFSDSADQVGISASFQINAAVDHEQGGNPDLLRDGFSATTPRAIGDDTQLRSFVGALRNDTTYNSDSGLSQTQSPLEAARELVADQHLNHQNASNILESEQIRIDYLKDSRDNLHGVNIDDETRKLITLEKMYAANATVIQVVSRMMDRLIDQI